MKKLNNLTQKRLKVLLTYNPETGIFKRNITSGGKVKGGVAGSKSNGYNRISIDGSTYMAHRLAFLYMEGYWPEYQIDHINRKRNDNRWQNLRHVTRSCNIKNTGLKSNNTSGVTGVSWWSTQNRYGVYINHKEKPVYVGKFKVFNDAVFARWEAEIKYDYPNCNSTSTAYRYLIKNNLI